LLAADAGETAVISFSDEVKVHQEFTGNPDSVIHSLRMLRKEGGGSHMLDAILSPDELGLDVAFVSKFRPDHERTRRLKMNESAPRRDRHGMCPIARSQLFHDVLEVTLDRFFGDKEPLCNIAIAISSGDVSQNVDLAIRERFIGEMLDEP
jgi:hypothetical protein